MSNAPQIADIDAERAALSSAWLAGDVAMVRRLEAEDFVDEFHRWLFGKLREVVESGEPLDMVAVRRRWQQPGGQHGLAPSDRQCLAASVAELLTSQSSAAHMSYYFRVLRTERLRRAVVRLAEAMGERVLVQKHEPAATLAWAGDQIDRLLTKVPVDDGKATTDAAKANAQPAMVPPPAAGVPLFIPAAARNSNGSAERDRAGAEATK